MTNDTLYEAEITALSFEDIQRIMMENIGKKVKIVQLSKVKPGQSLKEIMGADEMIILYIPVLSQYNGHYTSLFMQDGALYFMDSYGNTPKELVSLINAMGHVKENVALFDIIEKSGIDSYYNAFDFQSQVDNKIACCGRYACCNLILFSKFRAKGKHYQFADLWTFLNRVGHQNGFKDFDQAVTEITS